MQLDFAALLAACASAVLSAVALWRSRRGPVGPPGPEGPRTGPPVPALPASDKSPVEDPPPPDLLPAARECVREQIEYEVAHIERQTGRVRTRQGARTHVAHGAYTDDQRLKAVVQRLERVVGKPLTEGGVQALRSAAAAALKEHSDA